MGTLLFGLLQLTIGLALSNLLVRCLVWRSPQLAATICLLGITFAVLVLPLGLAPIPKFEMGGLQYGLASSGETATSVERVAKQAGQTSGEASGEASYKPTSGLAGSPVFNFRRLLISWQLPADLSVAAQWRVFTNCMIAWCLLVGLCLLRLIISLTAVLNLNRYSLDYENPRLQRVLAEWTGAVATHSAIRMFLSDRVSSPCVTWIARKAIYLPPDFDRWSEDEQLTALAHEVAHIVRRDAQWRLAFDFLAQLVAFHPLAWLLKRQLVLAQEMAADQHACWLLTAEGYRTGLCRVALRMDSQPQLSLGSFGVSVSTNSLVRRIKMLSSARKPVLKRWQQSLVITMFVTSCISLTLFTTGQDDVIRVATRSVPAETKPAAYFNRGASQPWDEVGVQGGYVRVLPSLAAQKPAIKNSLEEIADELEVSNLDCGIKLSQDFLSWTSNFEFKIYDLKEKHPQGHQQRITVTQDKPVLQFSREVDWAEVAEKFRLEAFAIPENIGPIKKFLQQQGRSKALRMVTNNSENYGNYVIAKSLWPVVDGGISTAVFPLEELAKLDLENKKEERPIENACLRVLRQCRFLGIGVDFLDAESACQLRLALVPSKEHTAAEVLEQAKAARASVVATMKTTDETPEAEKPSQAIGIEELEALRFSTRRVDDEIGEIVLIEGAIPDLSLLLPLL